MGYIPASEQIAASIHDAPARGLSPMVAALSAVSAMRAILETASVMRTHWADVASMAASAIGQPPLDARDREALYREHKALFSDFGIVIEVAPPGTFIPFVSPSPSSRYAGLSAALIHEAYRRFRLPARLLQPSSTNYSSYRTH